MATENTYTTGDYVVLDHPGVAAPNRGQVYTITRTHEVSVDLAPVSAGRACQAPKIAIRPATAEEIATAQAVAKAVPPLHLGSVVHLQGKGGRWVVIGLPGGNSKRFKLAALGGSADGRYMLAGRPALSLVTDF